MDGLQKIREFELGRQFNMPKTLALKIETVDNGAVRRPVIRYVVRKYFWNYVDGEWQAERGIKYFDTQEQAQAWIDGYDYEDENMI